MLLYAWHNIVYAVSAYVAGRWTDRFGPRNILLTGYTILILALIGFAIAPDSLVFMAVLFTLTGLSAGMQESVQKTFVSLTLPEQNRGKGLGLHASILGIGQLVSGVLIGGLWSLGSYTIGFLAAGFFVAVSVGMMATMVPNLKHQDS